MTNDPIDQWRHDPNYRLLQAEISALNERLDGEGEFGRAIRDLWVRQQKALPPENEEHLEFYRHILTQMMLGKFERIVTPDPINDIDSFGASLVRLNMTMDRKFAEVRALSEVSHELSEGLFTEDVLNHVFDTFRPIMPYDRIGFAVVETNALGIKTVHAHWVRSNYDAMRLTLGFTQLLDKTSLGAVAESTQPRIIDDLEAYLQAHPSSVATRLLIEEGVRSSLTCPLYSKGELVGFLIFSSRHIKTYRPEHIVMFKNVAGKLGLTLEKCRLYEDLTSRNQFIRSVFGRYLSDDIADALLLDPSALNMGGKKCQVTVLLSDIRGFTSMSEHMAPEQVVATLNTCFNILVGVIHRHQGTIDNIIGDALMVLFGAPVSRADDATRAVACALAMQAAMAEVNARTQELGLPALAIGIGINTGDVVAGNIGSEAHAKYSVIGAPVNLAARLESQAGRGEVLISQASYELVQDAVRILDTRAVTAKGFSEPVLAYSIARL
jgi:class 3 adenylate cyclase